MVRTPCTLLYISEVQASSLKRKIFSGITEQLNAMLGQQLVTAMASKQLFAHQLLQTLHLLAHRRLRSADGGRRGSKGVEIGDCYEGSQQIEIEIEYRTICTSHIFSSLISFKNNYPVLLPSIKCQTEIKLAK